MQVSVEKISNIERKLTIVVPANRVEEAYALQINRLAKKANIKGFRPGKAPKSYIEQRFGNDARQEALSDVIQKALYEAITEQKLRPVSTPQVTPKTMLANQPLEFTVSFEIMPEIEKIQFTMDKVEKLSVEVTPQDVDYVIEQLCKQYTEWTTVERAAQDQDRVVIDYYAIFEGKVEEEQRATDFPLELGSHTMIPGFEEGLSGAKVGEERTLSLHFPSDFHQEERRAKPVEFVVTIKNVFEAKKPVLDETFIKKLGVASGKLEDLQEQILRSITLERDRLVKEKLKEQVFRVLLEQNVLEIPKAMIEREAKVIHDEVYPAHQHHDHHQHSEGEMSAFNDIAKKRMALGILIAEYAKQNHLSADKDRVLQRIQEIASSYEHPQEVVEWLSTKDRLAGIEAQVMEDQVMDKLIEGIPVTETSMSYADLKGIRR